MATVITSECINCGACEPECPNTAIYQGGVEWELDGVRHPALSDDIFYIVPEKCSECVGFYDREACAAVCPVDCCVPDPDRPETEQALVERAARLHPDVSFGPDFPSRFREGGGGASASPTQSPGGAEVPAQAAAGSEQVSRLGETAGPSAALPTPTVPTESPGAAAAPSGPPVEPATPGAPDRSPAASAVPTVQPAAPATPAATPVAGSPPTASPVAASQPQASSLATATAGPPSGGKEQVPREGSTGGTRPSGPRPAKEFPEELLEDFEHVAARVLGSPGSAEGRLPMLLAWLGQPVLGGASGAAKSRVERVVGDPSVFSAARATIHNAILNLVLYPGIFAAAVLLAGDGRLFGTQMNASILVGILVGAAEWLIRTRQSARGGVTPDAAPLPGSVYAPVANVLARGVVRAARRPGEQSQVGFDGFYDERFDEKTERERRYGEIYRFEDLSGGYLFRLEFPHRVPASSLTSELGLSEEMPDYDYDINLENGRLAVRGRVVDPRALKLTAVAAAFPPVFTTRVELSRPVTGFRHRYRNKVLEIALPALQS